MPVAEPIRSPNRLDVVESPDVALLTTPDLLAARKALWAKRTSGLAYVRYADGSGNGYKTDAEMAAALAAIDAELARREGSMPPTSIRIASSKGLDTP